MILLINDSDKPLYQQLYEQLREQILANRFQAGDQLEPIRKLADSLGVSRNTVEAAYRQLAQEGYVSSRVGSGFVVQKLDLDFAPLMSSDSENPQDFSRRLAQSQLWQDQTQQDAGADDVLYDFTYGNLGKGSFPAQSWYKLTGEVLFGAEASRAAAYGNALGEPRLREQIAGQLHVQSGVKCHPAQVVIQAGTQASLYNLLSLFNPQCDRVAHEEPGYDGARQVFANAGFELCPIPVYRGSESFIKELHSSRARLAFVTPSNQFPTGQVLPLAARQDLLRWAAQQDAYIIEDDYCREFRYTSRPLPSLQSLDHKGRVIYMGTFSKALSPALRINFLVLPESLLFRWHERYKNHYPEVPWLSQAVLCSFIRSGGWEKHLRKTQALYKRKYQLISNALQKYLGNRVEILEQGSGLHLLVGTRDGRDQDELISAARREGVCVYETKRYWSLDEHPLSNFVLIGFSAIDEERIAPGIELLAQAWFGKKQP